MDIRARAGRGAAAVTTAALATAVVLLSHSGATASRALRPARAPSERGLLTVPAAALAPISAALGRDEPTYRAHATGSGFALDNTGQHLQARFDPRGVSVSDGGARLSLALDAYGTGTKLQPATAATPELKAGRVVYRRGQLQEWYANGPLGLEQGFTLAAPPTAAASPAAAPLTLSLRLAGNMSPRLAGHQLLLTHGGVELRYTGLRASDAHGHQLPAWLALSRNRLLIRVDTRDAQYPLRIDPLVKEGELTATSTGNSPLGNSVAVSGDTIVVGATEAAYVFTKPGGGWGDATQTAALSGASVNGLVPQGFGDSVAISGDTIVVGAPSSAIVALKEDVGAAYVFTMPSGGWASQPTETQTATLTGTAAATRANDQLGAAVAINSDTVAVGAPDVADTSGDGAVFEYTMPNAGWASAPSETQTAELTGVGNVGASVAVSGSTIVSGAPVNSTQDNWAGSANLFTMPNGGWATEPNATESAALYGSDIAAGDHYGGSIAISSDGNTVAVGAPNHTVGANTGQGAAYVFVKPAGGWPVNKQQDAELTAAGGQADDALGSAVAIDGRTVYAGAPAASSGEGGAYEFDMPAAGWATVPHDTQTDELTPGGAGYAFATALSSDGTALVAGAPGANSSVGAAFVYGQAAPTSVAFTISPYNDPTLSGKTLTFTITGPATGATYVWNFGNGHTATGTTVTYAYPAPPLTDQADNSHIGCPPDENPCPSPTTREAVYAVTAAAEVGGAFSAYSTKNIVVVPDQPPVANFTILRSSKAGGTGASTAVTNPITIVPQAALAETDSTAQDQIVKEAFWFNGSRPPAPPDVICLPNGACTHAPGEQDDGTGPIVSRQRPKFGRPASYAPTAGFESFSLNFWNAALAEIGSKTNGFASSPEVPTLTQEESVATPTGVEYPPLAVGYPPLSGVDLHAIDGYQGEQGVPYAACFPGDPISAFRQPGTTPNGGSFCDEVAIGFQVPFPVEASGDAAVFGPYDLAHYGVNSRQQVEDQANFLYNYATVVGVDTPLDKPCGPAIGATACSGHRTPTPRSITMVAYDSEGTPSAPVTQAVPLTPASNPSFSVCVADLSGHTPCVTTPISHSPLPFTINTGDKLRFELAGGIGGDNPIAYYTVAVGQPNTANVKYLGNHVTTDCQAPSIVGSWTAPGATTSHSTTTTTPPGGGGQGSSGPVSGKKQPATGPKASPDVRRPGGLITTSTSVPPFSDLEAGDFPAHNCEGYVARTVNASAPPGKAPTSGPNVKLHTAIGHPTGIPKPVSGSFPTLQAALHPVAVRPAPTVADPILVTSNANALDFTFKRKGTYSTSVAAYSGAGLGAITRIDGFLAEPAVHGGRCLTVGSQSISIPVPHKKGHYEDVAFSGNCMTVVTTGPKRHPHDDLFVSSEPIDVSGVPIAPRAGESIVIDPRQVPNGFYVAPCSISDAQLKQASNPCPDKAGTLYLALGGGSKHAPGLAELRDFTTKTADKWFLPLASGKLPTVGSTPKQGKKTNAQGKSVAGCGLYGDSQAWPLSPGAQYNDFKVVTQPCVAFSGNGEARVAFWDQLPQGFNAGGNTPTETSQVVLNGSDVPAVSDLTTNPYANVANAKRHPKPVIAGDFPTVRAHAAGADPGFPDIPNCPPSTNLKSGLSIPQGTDLGPISMPVGASFCYIAKTGDFIGNVKVDIPGPLPINGVEVGFEIGHGRLIDAGGDISGNIPVFPAVFINDFKFDIQTDPTQVAAEITASIADVLDVEGGVIVNSYTPEVAFEGSVSIAGIKFGDFSIDYTKQGIGMHVSIIEQFGPASLNITVKGAMGFSPFAFYLEGQGSACLFICLSVDGLVSNRGLAACGSINLVLVSFSGGFSVMWSGPNSGVHLFTGCDLSPFIPPSLRNIQTSPDTGAGPPGARISRAARSRPADDPAAQAVLQPGGSEQLDMCPPTAPTTCPSSTVAVSVHSLLGQEAVGETPQVTLTGPDGRVITTPTTAGYYGFEGSATMSGGNQNPGQTDEGTSLVDQNAVPVDDTATDSGAYCAPIPTNQTLSGLPSTCPKVTTTTMYIGAPGAGDWTLSVDGTSPPVVDVSIAPQEAPVTSSQFNPTVRHVALDGTRHGFDLRIAGHTFSSSLLGKPHRLLLTPSVEVPERTAAAYKSLSEHPLARDLDVPAIDTSRLRAVLLKVPSTFQGSAAILDQGAAGSSQVLASGVTSSAIPSGGMPVLFQPMPNAGSRQHIVAFLSNSAGMPSREITLSSFASPPVPTPRPPKILRIVRDGSTVKVYFDPGDVPIANGIGLALASNNGQQFQDTFKGSQLHAVGGIRGIGAARQASEYMVTVPYVDPTETIHVALDGSNDGKLSATSKLHTMRPLIASIPEGRLLATLSR